MTTWKERMNKEEYKNWLKVSQALLLMCEGIDQLTTEVMDKFHNELTRKFGNQPCSNGSCKRTKKQTRPPPFCTLCKNFEGDILAEHTSIKFIEWKNFDWQKWPAMAWEVAKVYMPKGQKPSVTRASETDSSALLNLMSNCKKFHTRISRQKPGKVIQVRNKMMHSAKMEFPSAEMKQHVQVILELLRDPQELSKRPEAQKMAKTIEELRDGTLVITEEMENGILKEKFEALECRIEELEGKLTPELEGVIEEFKNFISGNQDLRKEFQNDLKSLTGRLGAVEKRVDEVAKKVDEMEKGWKQGIKRPALLPSMFKNHLQQYAQEKKLEFPEYKSLPAEYGFFSEVCLEGKHYKSKELRTTKVDSQQDAAREALRALQILQEENAAPPSAVMSPFDEKVNYKGFLQEHFQKKGLATPNYENSKTGDNPPKFTASVTVSQDGTTETKTHQSEDSHASAKRAEQDAAKAALEALQIPLTKDGKPDGDGGSPKAKPDSPSQAKQVVADTSPGKQEPVSLPKRPIPTDGNVKGHLQEFIKKQGIPDVPVYEDIVINEKTFTANVEFKTKGVIQTKDAFNSKKEAESSLARQITEELGLDAVGNPKAKLNEMDPLAKPVYVTDAIDPEAKVKQYKSLVLYGKIDTPHEISVTGTEQCTTKKAAQKSVAKNAIDLLNKNPQCFP